jgi:hypothetical protein
MTDEQLHQEVVAQIEKAFAKARAEDPHRGPEWLAYTMQISLSKLHRLRKGEGDPSLLEVWRLAHALGLPIGWFAGEAIEADQRLASAAERAETAIVTIETMLDQLRADLADARIAGVDEAKLDRRASVGVREKRGKQSGKAVTIPREAAG